MIWMDWLIIAYNRKTENTYFIFLKVIKLEWRNFTLKRIFSVCRQSVCARTEDLEFEESLVCFGESLKNFLKEKNIREEQNVLEAITNGGISGKKQYIFKLENIWQSAWGAIFRDSNFYNVKCFRKIN